MTALLTVRELAERLQVSPHTAGQYLRTGVVPGFRLGGSGPWRVKVDVLDAWLAQQAGPHDVNRIEPRSTRSRSALGRKAS